MSKWGDILKSAFRSEVARSRAEEKHPPADEKKAAERRTRIARDIWKKLK